MSTVTLREAVEADLAAITEIQNALLATTAIEWRDEPHTVDERRGWLTRQQAAGNPVLVTVEGGDVVGWASYADFRDSERWPGYRLTVEHTIHVRESHWGAGIGRMLMEALMDRAREAGKHVLVAAVDGANDASIRFHEQLGFQVVARMPEVGVKLGRWLDLVLLQVRLDDRDPPPG